MSVPTNRESDKFVLRLPDGMRDRIKAAAEAANRSMNAEIVAALEEKYPAPRGDPYSRLAEMVSLFEGARVKDGVRASDIIMARALRSVYSVVGFPEDLPPRDIAAGMKERFNIDIPLLDEDR